MRRVLWFVAGFSCFLLIPIGVAGFRYALERAEEEGRRARAERANRRMSAWLPGSTTPPPPEEEDEDEDDQKETTYAEEIAARARDIEV